VASYPQPPGQPPQPPSGPPGGPPTGGPPSGYPAGPPGYQQPYPQPYPQQPYGYGPGGRLPFRRNAMLVLAQVLIIIQGCLGVLVGLGVILLGIAAGGAISGLNLHDVNGYNFAGAATGVLIAIGVVLLVLFTFVIIGGVRVGHPSQIARWLLAAFEILLLLGSVSSLTRPASGSVNGNGTVSVIVALVIEGLILYGLIIDPATYRAFARKNLR